MRTKVIFNIAIFIFLAACAFGQRASIESSAEPTTITIGDHINYTVTITHDRGIRIAWPGAGAELGQFQIIDYRFSDTESLADGRVKETFIYKLSTYDTGDWTIPPTAIAYISADDSTRYLRTEPINIKVKSLLSEEDWEQIKSAAQSDTTMAGKEYQIGAYLALKMAKEKMLKDVKPLWKLRRDKKFWIGVGIVALILFALAAGFIWWRKRRGLPGGIFSFSAKSTPPHEIALMELAALLASQHITKREFKIFYSKLSEILREYIERRIGVGALELSTPETMRNLANANFPLDNELMEIAETVLERSDLVKFAKLIPPNEWHIESVELAKTFVEKTKPEEPKEPENGDGTEPKEEAQ